MGSVSQMVGSTGLMREDITFIFLCGVVGVAMPFPVLFRMKFRFTNRALEPVFGRRNDHLHPVDAGTVQFHRCPRHIAVALPSVVCVLLFEGSWRHLRSSAISSCG